MYYVVTKDNGSVVAIFFESPQTYGLTGVTIKEVGGEQSKSIQPTVEASGGGEITGQYAPTNSLLKPEYAPPETDAKAPGTEKDDELIDKSKLSNFGEPVPGNSPAAEPEGSNTLQYDPREIALSIVKDKIGKIKAPDTKGTLFQRDAEGKPVIDGIDTPEKAQLRKEKSERVKQILGLS